MALEKNMSKVIVHIDLNAFFVRAEEIKNPSLENKAPVHFNVNILVAPLEPSSIDKGFDNF